MDLIFKYEQDKKNKSSFTTGEAKLRLYQDEINIIYCSEFNFYTNSIHSTNSFITYKYILIIDKGTGDFTTIKNSKKLNKEKKKNTKPDIKKNNFVILNEVINRGLVCGESRPKYWGVKYKNATEKIYKNILKILSPKFKLNYHLNRDNYTINKFYYNKLYTFLVDYYLDTRMIKAHNDVYHHIQHIFPKNKWLKENKMKFLPAVLDAMNIKSKYIVGEINKSEHKINLNSLHNLCKILGTSYIDFLKKINWQEICYESTPKLNKPYKFRDNNEINNFISLSDSWCDELFFTYNGMYPHLGDDSSFLHRILKMLKIRDFIENKGLNLHFIAKTRNQFEKMEVEWLDLYNNFTRGYKLKYNYPDDFLKAIEAPILIGEQKFKVKVLTTEIDFFMESHYMKNCMANQFSNGVIQTFIRMESQRKRINLSYQKGKLIQSYGKANTQVPDLFKDAINMLNQRFSSFPNLLWKKEKFLLT